MGLMMLVVVLFSAFYTAAERDHECCGENCPVCAGIRQCENALRSIGGGMAAQSVFAAPVICILFTVSFAAAAVFRDTLVSQNVRLNN